MDTVEIMKNNIPKVLFFYQSGRKERLSNKQEYAKEMFYGYHFFNDKNYKTDIVEFNSHKTIFGKYFFLIFEKRLRNYLKLPLYWSFLNNKNNLRKIFEYDYAIFSNNRMGCSALPMLLIAKIFNKKITSLCFVMGLFSRTPKYKLLQFIQKVYIKIFLNELNYLVFLSEGEFNFAKKNFPKYKNKYSFIPFAVDLTLWKSNFAQEQEKKYILFVGNDGNRDYRLAENISKKLSNEKFLYVSELIDKNNIDSNSQLISGSWGSPAIDDLELRNIYQNAKLTIIPLKDSLQPSGQSVALQSIACGTPVIITHTSGFWDKKNFKNKKNIFFAENNKIETWIEIINSILNMEKNDLVKLTENGIDVVLNNYDLKVFNEKIEFLITKET